MILNLSSRENEGKKEKEEAVVGTSKAMAVPIQSDAN
jgi:hypothetical protein